MATPIEVLQRTVAEKEKQIGEKELELKNIKKRCLQLMSENMGIRQAMQEHQDMFFALMYFVTDGEKPIEINIDNFRNFMQNAQFIVDANLAEDGPFTAKIQFFINGLPKDLQQTKDQ